MSTSKQTFLLSTQSWRGLGYWNFYFILKFALLATGYLNFDAIFNLIFLAFLLFPLARKKWHTIRNIIAIPIGIGLFYHDTWLPGIHSIISQGSQLAGFSIDYLLDLLTRFINWEMIGIGFFLFVAYLFISQWLRITFFTIVTLVWLNLPTLNIFKNTADIPVTASSQPEKVAAAVNNEMLAQTAPPTQDNLNQWLNAFYQDQSQKRTVFPASLPAQSQPFDILLINICSLAWDDIDTVNLTSHPLWSSFDILFQNFNSATSYSGPASLRLLRASCGQPSHKILYTEANKQCYLMDNLADLGFKKNFIMDHTGVFGNYINELHELGNMNIPFESHDGLPHELTSFDGSPIYNDAEVLKRWLNTLQQDNQSRSATFFNLIPLHDGNRFIGSTQTAPYSTRANTLFDQLDAFFKQLQQSGRKVMVIVAPEHGAALRGDKMQISGLRDIPSPSITRVPVGIKFIGMDASHPASSVMVNTPTSYLAVSELISRVLDGKVFTEPAVNWLELTSHLPETPIVSENDNAIVMKYQNKTYTKLKGDSWVPYPE